MNNIVAPPDPSFLEMVSDQLVALTQRVAEDVTRYADAEVGRNGGGFVIYYLTDSNGEPLKDVTSIDLGAGLSDIVSTRGFAQLREYCEARALKVRIDAHFYANEPKPTKIYRVIVDGWQAGEPR